MGSPTQFNNLQDMIAFIEDPSLLHNFFALNAPSYNINWATLSRKPYTRAGEICKSLEAQHTKSTQTVTEYDKLISKLRTIALVNAESENWAHLHSIMASKTHLQEFYENYFGASFNNKSANIAVFIDLIASGAMPDAASRSRARPSPASTRTPSSSSRTRAAT